MLISNSCPSFTGTRLSPQKLLIKFEKGQRPTYSHNYDNDKLQNELDILADQYRQSMTLDSKSELLSKERDIMYQELEHPELVLARNYEQIVDVIPDDIRGKEVRDILRLFSLTGIYRNEGLSGVFEHKSPEHRIDSLEKVYSELSEDNEAGKRGKSFVIKTLANIQISNPEFEGKITNVFDNLLEKTKDEKLRESILLYNEKFDKSKTLADLKNDTNSILLYKLITCAKPNDKETTEFINKVWNSEDVNTDVYKTAVWGAGRQRSDGNFEIIKDIALNKKEPDIRKREFAIHSVALYLREKPEEVKEVISSIKKEKSVFSDLARVLDDKINGNYHGQKDRELKYSLFNKKQIKRFKSQIKEFYKPEKPFSIQQENAIHRATIPFKKILGKLVADDKKYIIQHDTFTKQEPKYTGKRYIVPYVGIYNSGDFYDAFDGISTDKYNMMNYYRVVNSFHTNVLAHENGHTLQFGFFDNNDTAKLNKLYENAVEKDLTLDYYAAANPMEYFAQGVQAFSTVYHPHLVINNPDLPEHTRYELMAKDPDLYDFCKKTLKKCH